MSPVACCTPLLKYTNTEGERKQQVKGVKNSHLFRRNNAHLHHTVWNKSDFLWNQLKWRKDLVKGKIFCCKMSYIFLFCETSLDRILGLLVLNHMNLSKEILAQIYYRVQRFLVREAMLPSE